MRLNNFVGKGALLLPVFGPAVLAVGLFIALAQPATAAAPTPERINMHTIKWDGMMFYSDGSASQARDNDLTFKALDPKDELCEATIKWHKPDGQVTSTKDTDYFASVSRKDQDACTKAERIQLPMPTNEDRNWKIAFFKDGDKIESTRLTNATPFLKVPGSWPGGSTVYMEKKQASDCPSMIIYYGSGSNNIGFFHPIKGNPSASDANSDYRKILQAATGNDSGSCTVPSNVKASENRLNNPFSVGEDLWRGGSDDVPFGNMGDGDDDPVVKLINTEVMGTLANQGVAVNRALYLAQLNAITPGDTDANDPTCTTQNGLGWIACPLMEWMADATKTVADQIEKLLVIDALPLNPAAAGNEDRRAIYDIWSSVRNLANIVLVLGFFAIIFSQATSVGISSYGIKKLLPRLVIVAVAINMSYFVCAFAIDVFNILGAGVQGLFSSANLALPNVKNEESSTSFGSAFVGGVGLLALAGATVAILWTFWLPVLAITAFAVLTALLVLIFREVAIILLVIASPLAFAAWLLPGTEGLFKKWRTFFTNLLLMYPLIMAIFYGSILASNILKAAADPNAGHIEAGITNAIALIILALPLFSLPFLLKFAGSVGQRLGVLGKNNGIMNAARKRGQEQRANTPAMRMWKARQAEKGASRERKFASNMTADNARGRLRRKVYGGVSFGRSATAKEAQANIYDAYRENLAKTTERTRGRETDAGTFTATSAYGRWDETQNKMVATSKDKFMEHVLFGGRGEVTSLDGTKTELNGKDNFTWRAIAAQAAKSGDKTMYGKLLMAAIKSGNKDVEFALRDYGVNNASTVAPGHPDVVKGKLAGFKALTVDGLMNMDGSALERMRTYLESDEVEKDFEVGVKADNPTWSKAQIDADVKNKAATYRHNAISALGQAIETLNTNDNYKGRVPADGELAKAIGNNFGKLSAATTPGAAKLNAELTAAHAQLVANSAMSTTTPGLRIERS